MVKRERQRKGREGKNAETEFSKRLKKIYR